MSGPEVYSAEVKKTEVLNEYMRRSLGLRIREKFIDLCVCVIYIYIYVFK
jgi:DNA helicase TIP49 (TBP-interacting protein)